MNPTMHVAIVDPNDLDISDLVTDLLSRDVSITAYTDLREAYLIGKNSPADAVVFFSGTQCRLTKAAPMLRRLQRECASTLIYVVSDSTSESLALLADDSVEGFFSCVPTAEHLYTVISRARQIRQTQSTRSTPRYETRLQCLVKVVGIDKLAEGEVRQIGRGGFKAALKQTPFDNVTHDPIRFTLFDTVDGRQTRIEGFGEIRWSDTRYTGQGTVEVGVQFTDLPIPSRDGLLSVINQLRMTASASSK